MKHVFLFSVVAVLSIYSVFGQCQIPNADFENWSPVAVDMNLTMDLPDNWDPFLSGLIYFFNGNEPGIEQTTDAQNGSNALRLFSNPSKTPPIIMGDVVTIFECDQQPVALNGYYKLESTNGNDTATIIFGATKYNTVGDSAESAGAGSKMFIGNQSTYKSFSIPITYTMIPDTGLISIMFSPADITNATSFTVDNLSFGPLMVSVDEIEKDKSFGFYPNPANSELTIDLNALNVQTLEIFNSQGMIVYSSNGSIDGMVNINVSQFNEGMYFIQITDLNNQIRRERFIKN